MKLESEYWRVHLAYRTEELQKFTEHHATEAKTEFLDGGIRRVAALELVNRWNSGTAGFKFFLKP